MSNLVKRIDAERELYQLSDNVRYWAELQACIDTLSARFKRYGQLKRDTATRNMIKALRMLPSMNTAEEWARLHAHEVFTK